MISRRVRLCAINLGLISLLTGRGGTPHPPAPRTTRPGRLQQEGAHFAKRRRPYEALLPELRSSDPAALGGGSSMR